MKINLVSMAVAEAKQTLPEPETTFSIDAESGDITVIAVFKNVDADLFQKSKKTLVFQRLAEPRSVSFGEAGAEQVLALDEHGRQPLQVRISLTAPHIEEKAPETPAGTSETSETSETEVEEEE